MSILSLLAQNPLQGTIQGTSPYFRPADGTGAEAGGGAIEKFLSVFLGFFTIIGGLMFLMYFVFGGLAWLSASGDKGKVESARTQMTNAAIGLIIVILAQFIISIVGGVLGISILSPVKMLEGLWQ